MQSFKGKVVLITGAASGIGRATALEMARAGAQLVVCDVNEEGLQSLQKDLDKISKYLIAKVVDVSSKDQIRAFAEQVHQKVSAVDVLINNAGVGLSGGILESPLKDIEWALSINLYGVIYFCHYFVPAMVRHGGGHIVNVSSVLGIWGAPGTLGYSTSKFAVYGFSESLRAELRRFGIGVSTICPGFVNTGIIEKTRFGEIENPEAQRAREMELFKRRGAPPEKVARKILGAVRKNRGVVPVCPEAWIIYYLKRLFPVLVEKIPRSVFEKKSRAVSPVGVGHSDC